MATIDTHAVGFETTTAYLFECDDEALFAVSREPDGRNIPVTLCAEGWRLKLKFVLGVQLPIPFASDPEPILRGLAARGYYMWRVGGSNTKGTSQ